MTITPAVKGIVTRADARLAAAKVRGEARKEIGQ